MDLELALIHACHRADKYRALRPIAAAILGLLLERNLRRVVLRGQVQDLTDIERLLDACDPELADVWREELGDKAESVLKRDNESWRD